MATSGDDVTDIVKRTMKAREFQVRETNQLIKK